ncbi:hypothetical protein HYS28_00205 [Candidatus Uhrbacteria bacterium]|nr:hypothetical protein [Candidatus Uhrbacteria bacterium]
MTLILLFACNTPAPEKPDDTAGHNLEDSGGITDTGTMTTDDTATDPCAYSVTVWDIDREDGEPYPESVEDEMTMENELIATRAESSPEGTVAPSEELTIAHIAFTAPHADCPNDVLEHFQFQVSGMDYQHVQWEEAIREDGVTFRTLEDNALIATTADGVFYGDGSEDPDWHTWYSSLPQDVGIDAGTTTTVAVSINASGAQPGDTVYFRLSPDSMIYSVAGNAQEAELRHEAVAGNTLTFE